MKKKTILIVIAIIILFFLAIKIYTNDSSPSKNNDLIFRDYLDLIIEYSEYENEDDKKQSIYNNIYMMISNKALEEEAKRRGLKVTSEEVEQEIIDRARENDGRKQLGYVSVILKEKNITLEQYYRKYVYHYIEQELLNFELLKDFARNDQDDMSMPEFLRKLNDDFRAEHQEEIEQLEEEYGVSDLEFNPIF